jgi:hypothetical protein
MKWIIALIALMLISSPAFATDILNPSFENTTTADRDGYNPSNLLIPDYWFNTLAAPNNGQCVTDDITWNTKVYVNSTYGLTGSNSLMYTDDLNGDNSVCQLIQANNMSGRLTVYMDISQVGGDGTPCINMYNDITSMDFCVSTGGNICQMYDNCTVTNATGNWKKVDLDFASGYQWFSVWFYQSSGRAFFDNISIQFNDITAPSVAIASPTGTYPSGTTTVPLNISVIDVIAVDSCWYVLNGGSNTSIASCANTTIPVTAGSYNLTVYANDTSSNIGSNSTSFSVNASVVPPIITGKVTGATADIIGFLPLLIGIGIIVMIARKIEDMNSTEDFIAVIVGTGLAIVFLGVFAAIVTGLI